MNVFLKSVKSKSISTLLAAAAICMTPLAQAVEISPYFTYWGLGKVNSLTDAKRIMGMNNATYAFVVSNGSCNLDRDFGAASTNLKSFVNSGGNLIIAFGGAQGPYLEESCKWDEENLFYLMEKVLLDTGARRIEFDIEGDHIWDNEAHSARNNVVKRLQDRYTNLAVSFALPGWRNGLDSKYLTLLRNVLNAGIRISQIDVMAQSFGTNEGGLGALTIETMQSSAKQLAPIFGKTIDQVYGLMGVCPMIGKNDDGYFFTLNDAQKVGAFAKATGLSRISYWYFQRDQAQNYNGMMPINSYSSLIQSDFQFYNTFNSSANGNTSSPGNCNYPNWATGAAYQVGSVVKYSPNGRLYRARVANPGYNPTVSTYFWDSFTCQ